MLVSRNIATSIILDDNDNIGEQKVSEQDISKSHADSPITESVDLRGGFNLNSGQGVSGENHTDEFMDLRSGFNLNIGQGISRQNHNEQDYSNFYDFKNYLQTENTIRKIDISELKSSKNTNNSKQSNTQEINKPMENSFNNSTKRAKKWF